MGVGKAVLGSHGTLSIVWSENEPCCGTIAYFVGGKRGEDLVQYDMSQSVPIWENYLVVFVDHGICHGIYHEICLEICLGNCPAEKYLKNHSLPKFASSPPLGGRPDVNSGRPWNLIHSPPCRLFIYEVFLGPLGLHLHVWSELGRSPPFRPMRALRLQWSWAFNLVSEVALRKAEPVQVRFTVPLRDQLWRWLQHRCKIYMASNGSCFMVTKIVFNNHLWEVGLIQSWGTMAPQNLKPFLFWFIMCEDTTWIEIHWSSIWLRAWGQYMRSVRSHNILELIRWLTNWVVAYDWMSGWTSMLIGRGGQYA